jgi:hypothetical protein
MDQPAAARPHAKAAYRIKRPRDIGIGIINGCPHARPNFSRMAGHKKFIQR